MSRTIRKFPSIENRKPHLLREIKLSIQAMEALEDESFIPSNRTKIKANYKYAGDDFPMKVWDQVPQACR